MVPAKAAAIALARVRIGGGGGVGGTGGNCGCVNNCDDELSLGGGGAVVTGVAPPDVAAATAFDVDADVDDTGVCSW